MSLVGYNWDLENTVNRIFDDFVNDLNVAKRRGGRPSQVGVWAPAIDVHETDNEFIVNTEVPGVNKDQINVDVRDNHLIISGETKKEQTTQEGNTHIQERRFGSFTRSILLPPSVKADDISAKLENGVLELKLPKSAPSGKKIEIK